MPFNIFALALKNLMRNPLRTAVMAMGLAAVTGTLFVISTIYITGRDGIDRGLRRLGADAMLVPMGVNESAWSGGGSALLSSGPVAIYMDSSLVDTVASSKLIDAAASNLFIVSAELGCCSISDTALVGFEPERDFTITPWLRENLGRNIKNDEIIVGSDIEPEPGGRVQFYGKLFRIAGKLEPTGVGFMDSSVFIPMKGAREMINAYNETAELPLSIGHRDISAVMLRFKEGVDQEEAAVRLQYLFPGQRVILSGDAMRSTSESFEATLKTVLAAVVLNWAVCLAMIGVLYGLSLGARRREIGVMRALGAKVGDLMALYVWESVLLSASAGILGVVLGAAFVLGLKAVLSSLFGLPLEAPSLMAGISLAAGTLIFSLLSGLLATAYPTLKESRMSPAEAINRPLG